MDTTNSHDMVPEQEKGAQKDLKESITLDNIDDAEDLFLLAKERLLNVNSWATMAEGVSAEFTLTDHHGNEVHRAAHTGDYIKIKIPGPGNSSGEGFDWVQIEKIQYDDYPDANGEALNMMVRPATSPINKDEETAHFFSQSTTSTFNVERHARIVIAHYHGRNEVPNTDGGSALNTMRNVAVAVGGLLGFSDIQWKSLLKGLVKIPEYL